MKNNHKILILGALSALALTGTSLAQTAAAQTTNSPKDNLIAKIASKFNLKQEDVEAVFEEHHEEQRAIMKERFAERLDQAVTDGKITSVQRDLILNKQKEMEVKMEEIRDLEDETAKREAMQKLHTDLQQWAKDNNLQGKWLMPFHIKVGGPGPGHHGMGMMRFAPDELPATQKY